MSVKGSDHHAFLSATTDAARLFSDVRLPMRGKGACLVASGALGYLMNINCPEHGVKLVRGFAHEEDHWWIELDGKVYDPTAGQFDTEPTADDYDKRDEFPCGHTSVELLYAESERSFADTYEARDYIDMLLAEMNEITRMDK